MRLNFINKIYIAIGLILLGLIIQKILAYKASERFYYYSSVSAPSTFPIYIKEIDFILPDHELDLGFYKSQQEEVNEFITDWGKEYYFPEVHAPLRLPEKLYIDYCDYRSQLFYKDTIDLAQANLLQIFKKAVKERKTVEMYNSRVHRQGLHFVVGIANGGNVILWLRGSDFEKVILKKKLLPYEPSPNMLKFEQTQFSKKAFIDTVFYELPDSLKTRFAKGYDAEANYIDSPSRYLELK